MAEGNDAVRRICEGWSELSRDDWRELCTPDVKYQNMPWDRMVHEGPDTIHEVLAGFSTKYDLRLVVDQIGGDDKVAFAERTEHFVPKSGSDNEAFDLPVSGVFELRDGKVAAWRDYFDRRAFKG